jgi:hypothetical protein
MTSHTPAPGPNAPDGTAKPSQARADLLNHAALPATTATTAATSPKIPALSVTDPITSSHDLPARPAGPTSPDPGRARPHGRRAAALLAAATPLAVAALASASVAIASAIAPTAASTPQPGQAPAAELLNGAALPATIAGTATADPKLPPYVGD